MSYFRRMVIMLLSHHRRAVTVYTGSLSSDEDDDDDGNENYTKQWIYLPYYMKFWRHFNLAIFRKFWNISHLIFAISRIET